MKLIESKAELIQQGEGLDGLYKHIEACGRVPYKSEAKSDGTIECAKAFVEKMIKSRHNAVLEHGTVYLKAQSDIEDTNFWIVANSPYAKVVDDDISNVTYITTNLRAVMELFPTTWHGFLSTYMCEPTEQHVKRYTFKVLTSIGITREVNRSRSLSMLEMSTRYCNFSKDKFDNQVSFCKPSWLDLNLGIYKTENVNGLHVVGDGYIKKVNNTDVDNIFIQTCLATEANYKYLINEGWSAQQAREVLSLCTATEAVYTGFTDQWKHFFGLRYFENTGKVHPNMKELTVKMKEVAEDAGIWKDISNDNIDNN